MKRGYLKILLPYAFAIFGTAALTMVMLALGNHFNPTTVALIFLLFVLFLATVFTSNPALVASVLAMLCFNYFSCRRSELSASPTRRTGLPFSLF